jgi:hypothetical protein
VTTQEIEAMKAENAMLQRVVKETATKLNNITASQGYGEGNVLSSSSYLKTFALKSHLNETVRRIS